MSVCDKVVSFAGRRSNGPYQHYLDDRGNVRECFLFVEKSKELLKHFSMLVSPGIHDALYPRALNVLAGATLPSGKSPELTDAMIAETVGPLRRYPTNVTTSAYYSGNRIAVDWATP
jgi:hypothetical protein